MTESVYERVLGDRMASIAPKLRPYFSGGRGAGTGSGVFAVAGSPRRILRPVLAYLAWQHILFPEYAHNVPFDIVNTPTPDGGLHAVRTFHLPRGDRALVDTMRVVDGGLHDFMGRRGGFEVRMELSIVDGYLRMRSVRQWARFGSARIRLPMFATVTVAESLLDGYQHVDVRLSSPVLGEWFRYAGSFSYRYEGR